MPSQTEKKNNLISTTTTNNNNNNKRNLKCVLSMNIILCTFLQRLPAVLSRIGVILASPLVSYQPQLVHLPS